MRLNHARVRRENKRFAGKWQTNFRKYQGNVRRVTRGLPVVIYRPARLVLDRENNLQLFKKLYPSYIFFIP